MLCEESTQITEVIPAGLNITVSSKDDVIQPISLRCRGKTDPLTNMSVTWSLSRDMVDGCAAAVRWQLSDHNNSSASLMINSLLTLIAWWQQRPTELSSCCTSVLCQATNDLTESRSAAATLVRICLTPAEDFRASQSQSEPIYHTGT